MAQAGICMPLPWIRLPELSSEKILKGGSDRSFERITDIEGNTVIKMTYTGVRPENANFARIAVFLANYSLNVPAIYYHDIENRIVWMQDLGEKDLCDLKKNNDPKTSIAYKKALQQVAHLHAIEVEQALSRHPDVSLMPGFDESLYQWEQNYFLTHCVESALSYKISTGSLEKLRQDFSRIILTLLIRPRCLIHRDFQSQNIMWFREEAWLIDFQGLRLGNALYDIASLLYDPYVQISKKELQELFDYYKQISQIQPVGGVDLEKEFSYAAVQRLLQALGAYGNLALNLGKTHYLNFIRPALAHLDQILRELPELPALRELVISLGSRSLNTGN